MEWDRKKTKSLLLVVCSGVVLHAALQHFNAVTGALRAFLGVVAPLLIGGAIAFILNVPMRAIERHLFPGSKKGSGVRRPAALILTLVTVAVVLVLASAVIGPGIREAVESIAAQVPAAFARLQESMRGIQDYLPYFMEEISNWDIDWRELSEKAIQLVQTWGKGLLASGGGIVSGLVSGVATFAIGLVFSFYILLQKEKLSCQGRQVLYALLPERWADWILDVLRLANQTFSSFLSGQCLEAVILGTLFVIAMTIFGFPYALLVGVLIAITALVPIVGAFIGCGVGALLIAISNPWQALWFIILFLILQQIEGNLIYPHVVGSSVGLPSIWVLAAVSVGGGLFGIAGMLLFIPLCSVLYALFRRFVKGRLAQRNVPVVKWQDGPKK
jgi:predicted PurR-regulated permease PerM